MGEEQDGRVAGAGWSLCRRTVGSHKLCLRSPHPALVVSYCTFLPQRVTKPCRARVPECRSDWCQMGRKSSPGRHRWTGHPYLLRIGRPARRNGTASPNRGLESGRSSGLRASRRRSQSSLHTCVPLAFVLCDPFRVLLHWRVSRQAAGCNKLSTSFKSLDTLIFGFYSWMETTGWHASACCCCIVLLNVTCCSVTSASGGGADLRACARCLCSNIL